MHSYLFDVSYKYPEYLHIIPRDTIPCVVIVVVAYVPVLSGYVGGVDIVNCSLVILSVHNVHCTMLFTKYHYIYEIHM